MFFKYWNLQKIHVSNAIFNLKTIQFHVQKDPQTLRYSFGKNVGNNHPPVSFSQSRETDMPGPDNPGLTR